MRPQELNLGDIVQVGECGRFKDYIAKVIAISSESNHIGLLGTRAFEEYEEEVLGVPISPEWLKCKQKVCGPMVHTLFML